MLHSFIFHHYSFYIPLYISTFHLFYLFCYHNLCNLFWFISKSEWKIQIRLNKPSNKRHENASALHTNYLTHTLKHKKWHNYIQFCCKLISTCNAAKLFPKESCQRSSAYHWGSVVREKKSAWLLCELYKKKTLRILAAYRSETGHRK